MRFIESCRPSESWPLIWCAVRMDAAGAEASRITSNHPNTLNRHFPRSPWRRLLRHHSHIRLRQVQAERYRPFGLAPAAVSRVSGQLPCVTCCTRRSICPHAVTRSKISLALPIIPIALYSQHAAATRWDHGSSVCASGLVPVAACLACRASAKTKLAPGFRLSRDTSEFGKRKWHRHAKPPPHNQITSCHPWSPLRRCARSDGGSCPTGVSQSI